MSPDSLGGELYSSYSMGQGLEGLICASPSAVRAALRSALKAIFKRGSIEKVCSIWQDRDGTHKSYSPKPGGQEGIEFFQGRCKPEIAYLRLTAWLSTTHTILVQFMCHLGVFCSSQA